MVRIVQILILISFSSLYAQDLWEQIIIPDINEVGAINAEKEDTLFISAKGDNGFGGLLRSFDDGITWEGLIIDTTWAWVNTFFIRYDLNDNLYLATGFGIYKSSNNGDTFQKTYNGSANLLNIDISPDGDIYASGWNIILRSQDSGITWDTLKYQIGNLYFNDLAFGLNNEIYAVSVSFDGPGSGNGFHRTLDDGITWENLGITTGLLSIQINNIGTIIVGGYFGVETSDDSGTTWTHRSNIQAEVMESYENDKLIAGRYINGISGCWFSEDWGITWVSLVDNIIDPHVHQISVSPSNTIYIQSQYWQYTYSIYKSLNPILNYEEKSNNNEFEVFPNPVSNAIFLNSINSSIDHIETQILDLSGNMILKTSVFNKSIDVSNLNSGLFIIKIKTKEKTIIKKFIKI